MMHIIHNNEQSGPYHEEEIRQKLISGDLLAGDLAWKEGMPDWKPLGEVFNANPASPPKLQGQQLARYLPYVREWCDRIGGWLKASVRRPAYIVLWCCGLVFMFQSLQMGSLEKQIATLENTSLAGDLITSAILFFVSPEPFTPFFHFFSTLGGMVDQDATLEELRGAYSLAQFWRGVAVLTAIGTLFFLWFKRTKARRRDSSV
jgi:hypothetical protein